MQEIDFIPDWYKANKKQKLNKRLSLMILLTLCAILLCQDFIDQVNLNVATKKLQTLNAEHIQSKSIIAKYQTLKNQQDEYKKKTDLIQSLDSNVNLSHVLGELSWIIDKPVLMSKIEFTGKQLASDKTQGRFVVNNPAKNNHQKTDARGPLLFHIRLNGIASDASDVAILICSLEDSNYFNKVVPVFSRSTNNSKTKNSSQNNSAKTEFEISCNIANYLNRQIARSK